MKRILSFFIALLVIVAVALSTSTSTLSPADKLLMENLAALADETMCTETNNDPNANGSGITGTCTYPAAVGCAAYCPRTICNQKYTAYPYTVGYGSLTGGMCVKCYYVF